MTRVVVGVDGSESSRRALQWAAGEARRRAARLVVLHAWTVPAAAYATGSSIVPLLQTFDERTHFENAARATLDRLVSAVDLSGVDVDIRLVPGHAGQALVDAGRDASSIVVGSRGRGSLADLLVGSTTRYVSRHATVPVVVIPHRAGDADEGATAA